MIPGYHKIILDLSAAVGAGWFYGQKQSGVGAVTAGFLEEGKRSIALRWIAQV